MCDRKMTTVRGGKRAKIVPAWVLYFMLLFTTFDTCSGSKEIDTDTCVFVDHVENKVNFDNILCSNNTICREKQFRITYINVVPYVYVCNNTRYPATVPSNKTYCGVDEILLKCCGTCVNYTTSILSNITQLNLEVLEQSDFVFPILAKSSTKKLYGAFFLPYIHVPSVVYVTKNTHSLTSSILNCYPIVVLCLLLSVVSGFIAWLFETWRNKEEFPRPFLIGCFEGFWWAFISMTTVGYGDKTPKSIAARLYSIVWIMIGIIGFGILTGQLTGEIVKANSPPTPSMKESDVGVLRYRDHDTLAIVENGGRVMRNTGATDFYSDVLEMIQKLKRDEIGGMVLDKWTLAYVMLFCETFLPPALTKFFVQSTTRTEISSVDNGHSYGMLIRKWEVFQYFQEYVRDAEDRWKIISEEWWVKEKKRKFGTFHSHEKDILFAPSHPLFKKSMIAVLGMIALVIVFGAFFEVRRRIAKGHKKYQMTGLI